MNKLIMNKFIYLVLLNFSLICVSNLILILDQPYLLDKNLLLGLWSLFNVFLLVLYIFSFNTYIIKILFVIILFLNSFFLYISQYLNVEIGISLITSIADTNFLEAFETLNYASIGFILLSIFVAIIFCKIKIKPIENKKTHIIFIVFLLTSFIISGFVNFNNTKKFFQTANRPTTKLQRVLIVNIMLYPINYIFNISKYLTISRGDFTYVDTIKNNNVKHTPSNNKPYTIVLVIGETSRGANFSLNGYKRKTNPNLEKINNLVYFKNFESCYNSTNYSVSCLLSFYTSNKFISKIDYYTRNEIASSLSSFTYLNFDTYLLSTNSYAPSSTMYQYFKDLHHIKFLTYSLNYLDIDLNKELKQALTQNQNKNKLIILHTMGSHTKYSNRYPKEFAKFLPICGDKSPNMCIAQSIINDYDNTILYVDYVLSEFIKTLKQSNNPSLLIYTSDHGESLGDLVYKKRKRWAHGGISDKDFIANPNLKQQLSTEFHIPAFVWFSDSWLNVFGDYQLKNAKKLVNKPLNHDYISHSINDCAFISSKIINKQLSFCSAK